MKNIFTEWFRNLARTEMALYDIHRLDNKTTKIDQRVDELEKENKEIRRELERTYEYLFAVIRFLDVEVDRERVNEMPEWQGPRERVVLKKKSL